MGQVAMVEDRARLRKEYEIVRNARNTLHEAFVYPSVLVKRHATLATYQPSAISCSLES